MSECLKALPNVNFGIFSLNFFATQQKSLCYFSLSSMGTVTYFEESRHRFSVALLDQPPSPWTTICPSDNIKLIAYSYSKWSQPPGKITRKGYRFHASGICKGRDFTR